MKKKYIMGHYRIRLERSQYDFKWEQDKSASLSHFSTKKYIQN